MLPSCTRVLTTATRPGPVPQSLMVEMVGSQTWLSRRMTCIWCPLTTTLTARSACSCRCAGHCVDTHLVSMRVQSYLVLWDVSGVGDGAPVEELYRSHLPQLGIGTMGLAAVPHTSLAFSNDGRLLFSAQYQVRALVCVCMCACQCQCQCREIHRVHPRFGSAHRQVCVQRRDHATRTSRSTKPPKAHQQAPVTALPLALCAPHA